MEDSLWQDMWPQSPGGSGFLASNLPWLSLSFVCLCSPSSEPGVFPLSIFSPGTLDHPGVQSWTEVSGAVWCTPGFSFRSVSFWRWFLRMGWTPFWGLTSVSGGLAGQCLSVCQPLSPSAHLPSPPLPLSISSVFPCSPLPPSQPCFSPLTGLHCPPSLCPVDVCLFKAGVSKLFFFPKVQIENILGFVCCLYCNHSSLPL